MRAPCSPRGAIMRRSGGRAGRRRGGDALCHSGGWCGGNSPDRPVRRPRARFAAVFPGRLRDPSWGYYGPCARCSLTAPVHRGDSQAPPGAGRTPKGIRQSRCGAPQGAASGDGRIPYWMRQAALHTPSLSRQREEATEARPARRDKRAAERWLWGRQPHPPRASFAPQNR